MPDGSGTGPKDYFEGLKGVDGDDQARSFVPVVVVGVVGLFHADTPAVLGKLKAHRGRIVDGGNIASVFVDTGRCFASGRTG